ncbi:heat shock protein 67B2 [Angomonas deanei]|nr:heat shock protein 67B2 [Angomonas deanei]|eukprot:EPY28231.1 heat shock protein 67B2 [Angomonas deanei]
MFRLSRYVLNYISIDKVSKIVLAKQDKANQNETLHHTFIIDVRSTHEVQTTGMIPTAVCIPLPILETILDDEYMEGEEYFQHFAEDDPSHHNNEDREVFRPDKEKSTLIFYCAHGIRSAAALDIAAQLGYKHLYNFRGSWAEWYATYHDPDEKRIV